MIYITGDCHGDWRRFMPDVFYEQDGMTREDFMIICGDFGVWHDNYAERKWLDWLSERPFTTLFVDGNHENFDRLYSNEFPTEDFHGGKVHKIRDGVYHLMRGHIFELCGKSFFAFGGASSHDIKDGILRQQDFESVKEMHEIAKQMERQYLQFRVEHETWWKQEMPSKDEMEFGLNSLSEHGHKVDYIVTHCCPQSVASVFSFGEYEPDILTKYFNKVSGIVDFKKWFFGHYHDNKVIMNDYVMLYEQIIRIV